MAQQVYTIQRHYLTRRYAQLLGQRDLATPFQLDFTPAGHSTGPAAFATTAVPLLLPGQPARRPDLVSRPQSGVSGPYERGAAFFAGLDWRSHHCLAYTVRALLSQERLTELKNNFISNITHELKTPVATIGITAEALSSGELGPATSADYLAIIRQQAARLGVLIDCILQSVVAEQSGIALTRRPLDLAAVLTQAAAQVQPRLAKVGGSLRYQTSLTPLPVLGNAVHLTNVLATLLDNAFKYGRLASEIHLWSGRMKREAMGHLTNEGPPIPAQYQAQIFEKFFRVPTGNRYEVPGYGLSLYYARTLLERHGDSLAVHSQAQHTTFTLRLPLSL